VIVKKVPTNKKAPLKSKGLHARDLCDYIAGPDAGGEGEKIEHRGAVNVLNIDHDGQVEEIADLADAARRSPQPVQHWILSWRPGEQPTAAQADEVVRMFLNEMGLGEHQCIYALHRNTDNCHLHMAVNRVHPETERVATVNGRFDIEVAHRALARIERAQGWQREAGGRYRVLDRGEVQRAPKPAGPIDRAPATTARDFENLTGERSAQRIAIEDGAPVLRRARRWDELHAGLAERGMRFERKGSGAIIWVGDVAVKASTAGRDCSLSALQKRLGDFTLPRDDLLVRPLAPGPVDPTAKGWTVYAVKKRVHDADKRAEWEQLQKQQRLRWEGMLARHREERRESLGHDWRGRRDGLNAMRSMLAARQAQEKAELRERHEADRADCRERFPPWPPFESWLRDRGSQELADKWRFRDRTPALIVGDRADPARPRDIRAFTAEARGWEVLYRRLDSPTRAPSFSDRGREIRIHDLDRGSVLAALQLSAQKWGTFQVFGSDDYKRLCVDLAATNGFRIINPELQGAIAAARERHRQAPERATEPTPESRAQRHEPDRHVPLPRRSPPTPPQPRLPIGQAYRQHLDEVCRQPERARDDASRLDALVAVRLAVAGYRKPDVEQAIREGAQKLRPHEERDWNDYAKRAAEHGFGVSGERDRRALERRPPEIARNAQRIPVGPVHPEAPALAPPRRRGPDRGR
jgi:hypothetical protein